MEDKHYILMQKINSDFNTFFRKAPDCCVNSATCLPAVTGSLELMCFSKAEQVFLSLAKLASDEKKSCCILLQNIYIPDFILRQFDIFSMCACVCSL